MRKRFVGKKLFSASNPNSGIRANLCIVVLVRIERIMDAGIDFLIVTILYAFVHIRGIVGLQAALQTDLTLRRDWFHTRHTTCIVHVALVGCLFLLFSGYDFCNGGLIRCKRIYNF
jgi:hypothetical protein